MGIIIFENVGRTMVDELCELIQGENGFLVELRCHDHFNEEKYQRIVELLDKLIAEWRRVDAIPKKAMLAIIDLMNELVGGNRFLSEEESIRLEDASLEIYEMLISLYDTI